MSEDPTQTGELGPMPTPEIEPGEPNPGGVDAVPEEQENIPADIDPADNPVVAGSPEPLKDELSGAEDTHTEATRGDGGDVDTKDESPA